MTDPLSTDESSQANNAVAIIAGMILAVSIIAKYNFRCRTEGI